MVSSGDTRDSAPPRAHGLRLYPAPTPSVFDWQPGDIVACSAPDLVSRVIRAATCLPWPFAPAGLRCGPAHVAIIVEHNREQLWVESTTLAARPCLVQGARVDGWQVHRIEERIEDYCGAGGWVDVYRLTPHLVLSAVERWALTEVAFTQFHSRRAPYDLTTALLSGTRCLRLTALYPAADVNAVFCSELVATCLQSPEVDRLCIDQNAGRYNPSALLRRLVRAGTYRRIRRHTREDVIRC